MIERYYRRIIDGIPLPVIIVDKNLNAVFANDAFRKLFPSGRRRGTIGTLCCCGGDAKDCGKGECANGCLMREAFEDSFYSQEEIYKKVAMRVNPPELRDVVFTIDVKPLGDGMYMGMITDTMDTEMSREMRSARSFQQRLLPAGNWAGEKRYSYAYIPCREVGGDFPVIYNIGDSTCGMIADVSGKGMSAAMLTTFVSYAYDRTEPSPSRAIEDLREKFLNYAKVDEVNYITMAAVRIDKDTLTYSFAGHNAPILLKTRSGITKITSSSPPVGNWLDNPSYFEDTLRYSSGDILVLLTDGVTECRNQEGEAFGEDGVMRVLSRVKSADDFIYSLKETINTFCGNPSDDITAIAFDL